MFILISDEDILTFDSEEELVAHLNKFYDEDQRHFVTFDELRAPRDFNEIGTVIGANLLLLDAKVLCPKIKPVEVSYVLDEE